MRKCRLLLTIIIVSIILTACGTQQKQSAPQNSVSEKTQVQSSPTLSNSPIPSSTNNNNTVPEKPEMIKSMTAKERYTLNLFLSNFSEIYFGDFDSNNADRNQLIYFGCLHNSRNHTDGAQSISDEEAAKYVQLNDFVHACYKVSDKTVSASVDRYFGLPVQHGSAEVTNPMSWQFAYSNGYYYFDSGEEGDPSRYFSIADEMYNNGDGTYTVNFTNYVSGDLEILADCYNLTPQAAQSDSRVVVRKHGTAIIRPFDYHGTNTYQLVKYAEL